MIEYSARISAGAVANRPMKPKEANEIINDTERQTDQSRVNKVCASGQGTGFGCDKLSTGTTKLMKCRIDSFTDSCVLDNR